VWPGTESNCRHEDFQSSYRTGTMGHYRSLIEIAGRFTRDLDARDPGDERDQCNNPDGKAG